LAAYDRWKRAQNVHPEPSFYFIDKRGLPLRDHQVRTLFEDLRDQCRLVAPYWNTYANGTVCLGAMRAPKEASVSAMVRWETSFYESAFTHPNDAQRLTTHPDGSEGLWRKLAGSQRPFPSKYLNDAKQSLSHFLKGTP